MDYTFSYFFYSVGSIEIGLKLAGSVIAPLFLYIGVMVATLKISGYIFALNILFSNLARGLVKYAPRVLNNALM